MPFCHNCGKEYSNNSKFCNACGVRLIPVPTPIEGSKSRPSQFTPHPAFLPSYPSQPGYQHFPAPKPTGVTIIGIWQIIMGGFFLFVGFYAFSLGTTLGGEAAILQPLGMIFFAYGACAIVSAIFLLQMKNWARIASMVIQGLFAGPTFPIGTAIGIACIWYLGFKQEVKDAFPV